MSFNDIYKLHFMTGPEEQWFRMWLLLIFKLFN